MPGSGEESIKERLFLLLESLEVLQVAVRARPLNQRERQLECDICVAWHGDDHMATSFEVSMSGKTATMQGRTGCHAC